MARKLWTGLFALMALVQLTVHVDGFFIKSDPVEAEEADTEEIDLGKSCYYAEDCQPDECCLVYTQGIRKRSAFARYVRSTLLVPGRCQKLGVVDSSCVLPPSGVDLDPSVNVIAMETCPCTKELDCVAAVQNDIAYDGLQVRSGTCRKRQAESQLLYLLRLTGLGAADEPEAASNDASNEKTDEEPAEESQEEVEQEAESQQEEAQEAEPPQEEAKEAESQQEEAQEAESQQEEAQEAESQQEEAQEAESQQEEAQEAESQQEEAQEAESQQEEVQDEEAQQEEAQDEEAQEYDSQEVEVQNDEW